jgi:hypothetical protein
MSDVEALDVKLHAIGCTLNATYRVSRHPWAIQNLGDTGSKHARDLAGQGVRPTGKFFDSHMIGPGVNDGLWPVDEFVHGDRPDQDRDRRSRIRVFERFACRSEKSNFLSAMRKTHRDFFNTIDVQQLVRGSRVGPNRGSSSRHGSHLVV